MRIPASILLVLAVIALLASGCSRSQAAPFSLPPALPPISQKATPTLASGSNAALENQTTPVRAEGSSRQNQLTPAQVAATPASASTLAPLPTATRSRLPSPVSDLVYLSQDRLMRWDPLTRHAITLAQNVSAYAFSADGQVIVLLRPQKITANGAQRYNLDALRLQDQQTFNLIVVAAQPEKILVSPDGSQVAFTQKQAGGSAILLLPVGPDSQPRKLGLCQTEPAANCPSLAWTPDGRELVWSDDLGLWQAVAQPGGAPIEATRLHPGKVQVKDPKDNLVQVEARFTDLEFGPSERFILLRVTPLASQVGWQAVFDRRSGQLAQAHDTFTASQVQTTAIWGSNGNILVTHASEPGQQIPPFVHLWYVMPTNTGLLVSGQQFDLYSDEFPFSAAQSKSIPAHRLYWPAETQPNHLAFAVKLDQSDKPPVLFDLNLLSGALKKLFELPADTTRVLWAPDGVNALVQGGRNQMSWLSLKSGELTEIQALLGPEASQFDWLPPVLRR